MGDPITRNWSFYWTVTPTLEWFPFCYFNFRMTHTFLMPEQSSNTRLTFTALQLRRWSGRHFVITRFRWIQRFLQAVFVLKWDTFSAFFWRVIITLVLWNLGRWVVNWNISVRCLMNMTKKKVLYYCLNFAVIAFLILKWFFKYGSTNFLRSNCSGK